MEDPVVRKDVMELTWRSDTSDFLKYYTVSGGPDGEIMTKSNTVRYHGVTVGAKYTIKIATEYFAGYNGQGGGSSGFVSKEVTVREWISQICSSEDS